MRFLRTNTAVIITVGPFYDKTDGVTIETGLTISNERITLTADTDDNAAPTNILDNVTGATSGTANDLNYITGNDAGMMQLELAAANVNRLGRMFLSITDAANHVPVFHEFMVVPALVYDTFFASSGGATFPAATLASTTNITAGTVTTATNVTTVNGLAANVITAASMAADASAEIADAVWDEDATAHQTGGTFGQAIGDPAADTNTIYAAVVTNAAGATIAADVIAVQADTDDIQTRLPAALVGGRIDANTGALSGDATAADNAEAFFDGTGYAGTGNVIPTVTTLTGHTAQTGDAYARLGAPVGASISADIAGVQSDTDNIQTRIPAALTADGNMKADALRVGGTLQTAGDIPAMITAVDDFVDTEVSAIKSKTDQLTFTVANQVDSNALSGGGGLDAAGVRSAVGLASANLDTQLSGIQSDTDNIQTRLPAALVSGRIDASVGSNLDKTGYRLSATGVDDLLRTALTEGYAADGATMTLEQAIHMLYALLSERSIVGTTLTVKKLDGSTTAMTFTLDSATDPTSQTRSG